MAARNVWFYASVNDVVPGLQEIDRTLAMQYVRSCYSPDEALEVYRSGLELPEICGTASPPGGARRQYLVLRRDIQPRVIALPQRRGVVVYVADCSGNFEAFVYWPAGKHSDTCVIRSEIQVTGDPRSDAAARPFMKLLFRGFKKVRGCWVGPEAMRILLAGGRLTRAVDVNPLVDLQPPES